MATVIQPSFAKGELAPALYGRVDVAAYGIGLKTARNVFVRSYGGVSNRAGTEFIGPCKDHTYAPRLIPFSFKTSDAYMLVFGNQWMRVIRDGSFVLESDVTITGATQASPCVVTATAHGFSNGDDVYISGVAGMTRLNGRFFRVAGVTANTFQLMDQVSGSNIDSSAFAAYTSGGTVARVYTLTTPYVTADLTKLKYVQSADVMTLVHPGYAPRELTRTGHTSWTLTSITFAPSQAAPTGFAIAGGGGAVSHSYYVTAINSETGEESLAVGAVTSSSMATRANSMTWNAASGAGRYRVYLYENGVYGLLGETEVASFTDSNITPDLDISPVAAARNPFSSSTTYPGAVAYYEQRRVFGGSTDRPDGLDFSQIARQSNFNKSTPLRDDDAIRVTLSSQEVNEVRGFAPGNDLLILTSGSEVKMNSGADAAFAISTLKQKPQSFWGSGHHRPIIAGSTTLFVEENNSRVRSLGYNLTLDGYTGNNLGILSAHLLDDGKTIVDWAYSHAPEGVVYMARSDGQLLTMTYNQEQEVVAWTHWDTSGDFERVGSLRHSEGETEDSVFYVVKRRINGQTVRYVEKSHSRVFDDVRDCYFVDCGLSLDAPVTITGATAANPVVITAASHGFSNGDEVDIFDIEWEPDVDGELTETQPDQLNTKRYTVANAAANTFELTGADGSAFNAYVEGGTVRKAVSTISGLDHLEGRTLVALCDGNVVKNLVVSGGSVTLPRKFSRVHAGLRFIADVETLNIEAPSGTIQGLLKKVSEVTFRFEKSRGFWYGHSLGDLREFKQRAGERMGDPTELLTGDAEVTMGPKWDTNGTIFLRQMDPLPFNLLAAIPDIQIGG